MFITDLEEKIYQGYLISKEDALSLISASLEEL